MNKLVSGQYHTFCNSHIYNSHADVAPTHTRTCIVLVGCTHSHMSTTILVTANKINDTPKKATVARDLEKSLDGSCANVPSPFPLPQHTYLVVYTLWNCLLMIESFPS